MNNPAMTTKIQPSFPSDLPSDLPSGLQIGPCPPLHLDGHPYLARQAGLPQGHPFLKGPSNHSILHHSQLDGQGIWLDPHPSVLPSVFNAGHYTSGSACVMLASMSTSTLTEEQRARLYEYRQAPIFRYVCSAQGRGMRRSNRSVKQQKQRQDPTQAKALRRLVYSTQSEGWTR